MRQLKRITGIEGVAPSGRARIKLPVNARYFALNFFTTLNGAAAAADSIIERVRLYVNGLPMWDVPASYLLARVLREGRTLAVGELPLDFADASRADKIDEAVTAWNLFGETSFEAELTFKAQAAGAVVSVDGVREIDYGQTVDAKGNVLKQITKIITLSKNANGGINDVDNIPTRDAIQRITFFGNSLPTEYWVDADQNRVVEGTDAQLARIYAKAGHVAQAGSTTLRFDYTEKIDDFLVVRNDLNVRFNVPAAGALDLMIESLAPSFI